MGKLCAATLALLWPLTAPAQECVTCRAKQCADMLWVAPCGGTKPPPKPATPIKVGTKTRDKAECRAGEPLALELDFPSVIPEGELVGVRIRASCTAYLIVYYVEETGAVSILWPSAKEPAPMAQPGRPAVIPSARERAAGLKIEAQLRTPGKPARETFVVVGLAGRAELEADKPAADRPEGLAYVDWLKRKLEALPHARWSMAQAQYQIEPRHE